jgi:hypothetical protein
LALLKYFLWPYLDRFLEKRNIRKLNSRLEELERGDGKVKLPNTPIDEPRTPQKNIKLNNDGPN